MAYLLSVCFFFGNSPKRQKLFEYFIDCYKDELKLPDTKLREIKNLSKIKWVESDHTYDTYYLLFNATVYIFESIFSSNIYIYHEFYLHLKERLNEKRTWEIKGKWLGLFVTTRSFEHILAFLVVFDCLESLKPFVTRSQK